MDEREPYDEKLERILRQASGVFAEKGYDRASIRDIAAATDVSVSGLYYYFGSKEELLYLIQTRCFETILERLERDLEGVDEPEDRLRILVGNHLRFFVNNMAEMKVLSHEADSLSGELHREVTEQKRAYTEEVHRTLEALAPEEDGVDGRVATFALFGMMNWIYNWYRPGRDVPVDELAEEMLHIFLDGYRSPPRRGTVPESGPDDDRSIWRGR